MVKPQIIHNSKGLSLVEVVIAVFLVGVMALVISNIPHAITLITGSRYESTAREVAAKAIEDARFAGYENLANGSAAINNVKLSSLPGVAGTLTVVDCPIEICSNNEEIKQVTAFVSWTENNEPKNVTVATLVSKGGLK